MDDNKALPPALALLSSERPRNVNWFQSAGLLFGDWGTSRLYVLGLAFATARRSSLYLILAMSLLILAVGWAYTQICRIYPDGGGVYTAAKKRSRMLAVVGALLLFADYTVTASLSALEAFHYFGLPLGRHAQVVAASQDSTHNLDDSIVLHHPEEAGQVSKLLAWDSPGLWAIVSIVVIGAMNLLGPKHTAGYAVFAAGGMVIITLLVAAFGVVRTDWSSITLPPLSHPPGQMWEAFVAIVLALSGVEAIANLTGIMKKPVYSTARKAIWTVATEVALLNVVLALIIISLSGMGRYEHREDMLAYMAKIFVGVWGEYPVRIIGGLLLLSATNTAVNGLMSITYVMSRDGEMPRFLQKLNSFGAPWIGAMLAAAAPALVLVFVHDLQTLASLYAIGVVGAVAININLCAWHPRLRKWWRRACMIGLGLLLIGIGLTLAWTKRPALLFVTIVLLSGLVLRKLTQWAASRRPKPSLLRQAIMEQLTPEALAKPKLLLATAGSDLMADTALQKTKAENAALVVCFVREVALSYKVKAETRLNLDTDPAAQALFTEFLEHGHQAQVPIIPMYDTGSNAAEIIAETAAMNGVQKVLIGSSRRGALHQMIKGSFQRRLESLLPPEIPVEVLTLPRRDGKVVDS
jgi:amino acid transporter